MSNRIVSMKQVINSTKTNLFNTYTSGSGVGANTISNRRAKLSRAHLNKGTMQNPKTGICNGYCVNGSLPHPSGNLTHNLTSTGGDNLTSNGGLSSPYQPTTKCDLFEKVDLYVSLNVIVTNEYGNIADWDLSLITDTSNLFNEQRDCNGNPTTSRTGLAQWSTQIDISSWDVSNVTNMSSMFEGSEFSGSISLWNVSSVTDMSSMFKNSSFNSSINMWDVTNVTDMSFMFKDNSVFNTSLTGISGEWITSSLTTTDSMFEGALAFNVSIDFFDMSNVTTIKRMFKNASSFDKDLSSWDVTNVTDMSETFYGASVFNRNINSWTVSNVTTLKSTFYKATLFDQPLSSWATSNVTTMESLFEEAINFNREIDSWDLGNVTTIKRMFKKAGAFDRSMQGWDTSNVTDMSEVFYGATAFGTANGQINTWETTLVINMSYMFRETPNFNNPLPTNGNQWDVSNVIDMRYMFYDSGFNQDLTTYNVGNPNLAASYSGWNPTSVENISFMFARSTQEGGYTSNCIGFADSLQNVKNAEGVFMNIENMDIDFSPWKLNNCKTVKSMCQGCTSFSKDVFNSAGNFKELTSCVTFDRMFSDAVAFTQSTATIIKGLSFASCREFHRHSVAGGLYDEDSYSVPGNPGTPTTTTKIIITKYYELSLLPGVTIEVAAAKVAGSKFTNTILSLGTAASQVTRQNKLDSIKFVLINDIGLAVGDAEIYTKTYLAAADVYYLDLTF